MTTSSNERLATSCIAVAVLAIRDITDDPAERVRIIERYAANMTVAVNNPSWGRSIVND